MRSELLKELPLVEQRVHQVGVVVQRVAQAGVDDFQHHADHFLNHIQVLGLEGGKREDAKVNWFPTMLLSLIMVFVFFLNDCLSTGDEQRHGREGRRRERRGMKGKEEECQPRS